MRTKRVFSVVLASPSDVQTEREELKSVVDNINSVMRATGQQVIIELLRWETDAYPGMHTHGPQGLIDEQLRIEECDALIGVFWERFGTSIRGAADSGTAHEIRRAIAAWKSKGTPHVMLYFRNMTDAPNSPEGRDQRQRVEEFKRELRATDDPIVWSYKDPADFSRFIAQHLSTIVQKTTNQFAPVSALQVSLTANTLLARHECHTELVGELLLRCTYDSDIPYRGQRYCDVDLHLSAPITSRPLEDGTCDIILCEPDSAGDGTLIAGKLGSPGSYKVTFPNVPLDIAPRGTRTFQISNVRCDCTVVPSSAAGLSPVFAYVTMTGVPVENPQQVVAKVTNGLTTGVAVTGKRIAGIIATLTFTENFAAAFKSRASHSGETRKNIPLGGISTAESSPFSAIFMVGDSVNVAGLAESGTRFQADFLGVSEDLRLFVSVYEHGTDRRARLLAEVCVPGESTVQSGIEVRELSAHNGHAVAIWEVLTAFHSERMPGSLSFAVIAARGVDPTVASPPPGEITVICGFSPRLGAYSSTAPIPHFSSTVNVSPVPVRLC
jgi:hypothetical protein